MQNDDKIVDAALLERLGIKSDGDLSASYKFASCKEGGCLSLPYNNELTIDKSKNKNTRIIVLTDWGDDLGGHYESAEVSGIDTTKSAS